MMSAGWTARRTPSPFACSRRWAALARSAPPSGRRSARPALPALKAFLQGEQFYRQTNWDSAYVYYDRAIALDSSFAPALRRQSGVLGWARTGFDSLSTAYAVAAGMHNHGLPPRDSLLVLGDSLMASLLEVGPLAFRADSSWGSRLRRAFAGAEQLTSRYPDDPEAWLLLGELSEHLGPYASRPADEAVNAFDRAIALDSAFAPSYIHPVERAALSGPEVLRRYLRPYLALNTREHEGEGDRLVQALIQPGVTAADVSRLAAPVSLDGLFEANNVLSGLADSAELGIALARVIDLREPSGHTPFRRRIVITMSLARNLMTRGHLAAAYPILRTLDTTWVFADGALMGVVPQDSASAVFRRRLAGPVSQRMIEGFPWWAGRRDTVSLATAASRADSEAKRGADPTTRMRARYAATSAAAYLALARVTRSRARALQRPESRRLPRLLPRPPHAGPVARRPGPKPEGVVDRPGRPSELRTEPVSDSRALGAAARARG